MSKRNGRRSVVGALALAALGLLAGARPARADVNLWPLFESNERGLTVLYPLYVQEGAYRLVFPVYARTNQGHDHHVLWPLVKVSEGKLERVAPVWFANRQDEYTFFPFYRSTPHELFLLLPPLYSRSDGTQFAVLPFYSRVTEQLQDQQEERLSVLWPLYRRTERRDAQGALVEQSRAFLAFTETRAASGARRLSLFGLPLSERVE